MDATYVLTVKLREGYDGPVLDEASLMVSALNIINGGEDEVPILGVSCSRVDVAPDHADDELERKARLLLDDSTSSSFANGDEAYREGWRDALHEMLGESDG